MKELTNENINLNFLKGYLENEFSRRCKNNPSYSLRSFSRDLKIDSSTLSKIFGGKRNLGKRLAKKLISNIEISSKNLVEIMDTTQDDNGFQSISIDYFSIISDWYHYAILEMLRVDNFNSDVKWISKSLNINTNECKFAIDRLVRCGLIKKMPSGELIDISGSKTTNISKDMKNNALKEMQKQLLKISSDALYSVPYEKRNNTSMTMAIDSDKLPQAVEEIKKFRRKMAKLLSRGEKRDQVYNMSIALCPLSQISLEEIE